MNRWTGLVSRIIQLFGCICPEQVLGTDLQRLVSKEENASSGPVTGMKDEEIVR